MKKYKSNEFSLDTRICGKFNESPLAITKTTTHKVLESEQVHLHEKNYEYYIFIKGKAKIIVENEIFSVYEGDTIMVEPNEKHKLFDICEETTYITIKTNNDSNDKKVFEDKHLEKHRKKCKKREYCRI